MPKDEDIVPIDLSSIIPEVPASSYDDTALANRVSALETELNGVSEQITELNNMVV